MISNKAVADGAVSYHVDSLVSSRVAKFTYGTECSVPYDSTNPEHRARQKNVYRGPSGMLAVPKGFGPILIRVRHLRYQTPSTLMIVVKGTRVGEEQTFEEAFVIRRSTMDACEIVEVDITAYRGSLTKPDWTDTEPGKYILTPFVDELIRYIKDKFTTLCNVRADTSKLARKLSPKRSKDGITYYAIDVKIILLFGLTELKAQVSWIEEVS